MAGVAEALVIYLRKSTMGLGPLLLHCLVILLIRRDSHPDLMAIHAWNSVVLLLHHEAVYLLRFLGLAIAALDHEVMALRKHSLVVYVDLH